MQAGIPSLQLKFVVNSEAAAFYVIEGVQTVQEDGSMHTYMPGTKLVLADLGGEVNMYNVHVIKDVVLAHLSFFDRNFYLVSSLWTFYLFSLEPLD